MAMEASAGPTPEATAGERKLRKNMGRKATTMARVAMTMGGSTSFMAEAIAFSLGSFFRPRWR